MKAVSVALLVGTVAGQTDCVLTEDAKKVFKGDMATAADMQAAALNLYKMIPKHEETGGAIGKDGTDTCADPSYCNCPMKVLCGASGEDAMKAIQESMGKDKTLCVNAESKYTDFQKTVCGTDGANIKADKTALECKDKKCAAATSGNLEAAGTTCDKYKVSYKAPTENGNASVVALMLPAAVVAFFM